METVMQDLRYGVRLLFKNPGFAALVALVLIAFLSSYIPAHRAAKLDPVWS